MKTVFFTIQTTAFKCIYSKKEISFKLLEPPMWAFAITETAWPNDRNLEWSIYGRSSINPLANMDIIDNSLLWKIFSSGTAWPNKTNFTGIIYGRSSIRSPHFIPIWPQTWSSWAILLSEWLKFKQFSLLKLGGTMNWYFVGMMYGGSRAKLPYFVAIILLIWLP